LLGVNGDENLIKDLVASGFPVIVSQWVSETEHVGHYRPVEAFDDVRGGFIASDPYLGPDHFISYEEFDRIWATNSRRFMVIYPTAKQQSLQSVIVSSGWDKTVAYQADLAKLQRRFDMWKSEAGGGAYQQRFGALAIAWDEIELGQLAAATAAVHEAQANGANPIVIGWFTQALANSRG
jgi:hypothetical protein